MLFHIQYVSGTQGQTGHLAERIRVLRRSAPRSESLNYGWIVTESRAMTEEQVRDLLRDAVDYPDEIPIIPGDYSTSDLDSNRSYFNWGLTSSNSPTACCEGMTMTNSKPFISCWATVK